MEVIEFRFITNKDIVNSNYVAWSRIYEYPLVLQKMKEIGLTSDSLIHNTSWGFEGCHVLFKEEVDRSYSHCLHSDIKHSSLPKTMYYDITQKIDEKYHNYFDCVINISTVEEVPFNNIIILNNLLQQVKPNGYLILTFDYSASVEHTEGNGSMNLAKVSQFINKSIENNTPDNNITGTNSLHPDIRWSHLQCGLLIIKKI